LGKGEEPEATSTGAAAIIVGDATKDGQSLQGLPQKSWQASR